MTPLPNQHRPNHPAPAGTWVLLRGLTREAGHWGGFTQTLQARLPAGALVLTPDLPGNGVLHEQASPIRVEEMAQALRQQLFALDHRPPYRVVAMSLGAMVTVAWMAMHPSELSSAVLINTSLRPHSPFWQRLQPRQYTRVLKLLLGRPTPMDWERAVMAMTCQHPPLPEQTLLHWLALRAQHPVRLSNALRQLWAASRYRAPRSAPSVPTLLLHGAQDQLVHPDCTHVLAHRWGWPVACHPTAGHDLPQDDGPWVADQVAHWLQTGQPRQD